MKIPSNLQISVYHEGVLLLLGHSSYDTIFPMISEAKKNGQIIEEITNWSDTELYEKYNIGNLSIGKTDSWASFLEDLQKISDRYEEYHPIVLGSVIEIMDNLNWQDEFDHRKLLTLFLDTQEELAHLKLATSGTENSYLEVWRKNIIEESQGYASYKSKIA